MSSICVIAHDPHLLESLAQLFDRAGFTVSAFTKSDTLLRKLHKHAPQCVVAEDLSPAEATTNLLEKIHHELPELPVILIAKGSDVSSAVEAIRAGAFDCLQMPIIDRILIESVNSAISGVPN